MFKVYLYNKNVHFRKENLMRVVNLAGVEAVLGMKFKHLF